MLKDVNQEYILKMIYNFHKQKFGYNQIIFEQNEDIDGIYIIKKGDISVNPLTKLFNLKLLYRLKNSLN